MDEEVTTGVFSVLLRGAALALRFALPLALIRLLGLEAAGLFALTTASAAIAPAALGWGLNNLLTRDLVLHPDQAPNLIATRLAVTLASSALALLAATVIFAIISPVPALPVAPALALIALETLALDIHVILIALGRARRANLLLFLRSAGWIPIFLFAALSYEQMRRLDIVLSAWIAGHAAALALLAPGCLTAFQSNPRIDGAWLRRSAPHGMWIYAADLGLVAQLYADRYLVGALLGLEAAGVYGVCAAFGQSLQILASSAVVQPALPKLIAAAGAPDVWSRQLRPLAARLLSVFVLFVAAVAAGLILLAESDAGAVPMSAATTLCLLSLAAGARSFSDGLNAVLIGLGRHRAYAALSLAGAVLSLALAAAMLPTLGMPGAGVAAVTAAFVALFGRAQSAGFGKNRGRG